MSLEALKKRSSLAIKNELTNLTGTLTSSLVGITGSATQFVTELAPGDVIGNFVSGFRRVVGITDATHMQVDSAFDSQLAAATAQKQDFAASAITPVAGDVIEFVDFTLEPDWSEITRNVVRNTFDELEPIIGEETVTGGVDVELHGSGVAGTPPESDPLWLSAFGERRVSTATTTTAGSSTTSINVASAAGLFVGAPIILDPTVTGTGAYEVSWITAINTNALTVSPAFSLAPPTSRAVGACVAYLLSKNEHKSFASWFWRGDITLEKYLGCKVETLALDYAIGQTVNPKFTVQGKVTGVPTAAAYSLGTPSYDTGLVHVARYMAIKMAGTTYALGACGINVANELYRRKALTTAGTENVVFVKRTITGTFTMLYDNKDIEAAFRAGTTAELVIISSTGAAALVPGNTFGIRLPKIKYTKVPKSEDSGIYQYSVSFKAILTASLGEDSIFAGFL
jgi:hypothetical protein